MRVLQPSSMLHMFKFVYVQSTLLEIDITFMFYFKTLACYNVSNFGLTCKGLWFKAIFNVYPVMSVFNSHYSTIS